MATKDKLINLEDLKVLSDHVEGEVTDLKSDLTYLTDDEAFTSMFRSMFALKIWYGSQFRNYTTRLSTTTPLSFPFDVTVNNPFYALSILLWSSKTTSSDTLISNTAYTDKEVTIPANSFFTVTYSKTGNAECSLSDADLVTIKVAKTKEIDEGISLNHEILENAFSLNNSLVWEQGRYSAKHGGKESSAQRIRTVDFLSDKIGVIFGTSNLYILLHAWSTESYGDVFQGTWTGSVFEKTTAGTLVHEQIDLTAIKAEYPNYKFKLTARIGDGTSNVAVTDGTKIYCGIIYKNKEFVDYEKIARSVNRIADNLPVPHQSIVGYKYAYNLGFRAFLCDLRFTADNVPICQHDAYMNENYSDVYLNGSLVPKDPPVYFADKTLAELQAYDFGVYKGSAYSNTKILTLEEMLKLCKNLGCYVYLEMKVYPMTEEQFAAVFALIYKYGMTSKVVWAPQSISAVNQLHGINQNVYIQFHTNTAGSYENLPDTFVEAIVNATNDYNRGHNTMIVPLSVGLSDSQLKTLSENGIGLVAGIAGNSELTLLERYINERPAFVEGLTEKTIIGKHLYESEF